MQNQWNLNVLSKCILNALRIRKGYAETLNSIFLKLYLEAKTSRCSLSWNWPAFFSYVLGQVSDWVKKD